MNKGPIARPTTQRLAHPIKAPHRQHVPQLSPLARQSIGQSHPRDQLLVEPGEGIAGDRGAARERGGGDGYGCIGTVSFVADRLKAATDLGGSLLL